MRVSYVIETEKDSRIRAFFCGVDEKLRNNKTPFLSGAVHSVGREGLYAVSLDVTTGLLPLTIGPIMMIVGGYAAWFIWHSVAWSNWLTGFGACLLVFVATIVSPRAHAFVMRRSLKKLLRRDVKVVVATSEAVRRLAYGEV